ncbi:alpha/beta fold hydrolase [Roseateles paludis]|jgi:sigma-B regulation protein RsbQ|uniref:Alpha/beta hydrolase n=1 Tax=Roseateles paludis TaxID=3145238 RepID=A0ABV0FYH4_9BURK
MLARHQVTRQGQGEVTLLFLHGFGTDQTIWRFVAPALESRAQTLTYDHAGCGAALAAWDVRRHASLQGYAQDLIDILDQAGLERVLCVGHSIGSIIAMLAALQQPARFERIVALSASPCFVNHPPDYLGGFERSDLDALFQLMQSNHFGWAQFLAPKAIGEGSPLALTQQFEEGLCSLEPSVAQHFARLVFLVDVREELQRLSVPTLLVQCLRDSIAPAAVGRWLAAHLPQSRLIELAVSGHCPHISHPHLILQILEEVLDARSGA